MAICLKCGCRFSQSWGPHHCKAELPDEPASFDEVIKAKDGSTMPKRDYHDRRAWLEYVTGVLPSDAKWLEVAAAYRDAAEQRAREAQAAEALRKATV